MHSGDSQEKYLRLGMFQKTLIRLVAHEMLIIWAMVEDRVLL